MNQTVKDLTTATSPCLIFPTTTPFGSPDNTDGLQTVIVANNGNASLFLPPPVSGTNPGIAAAFSLSNSNTCPQLSTNSS